MTDDNDVYVPIAARVPRRILRWLERKRAEFEAMGLDASLSMVIKQQLEQAMTVDETPPKAPPKKARPHP